MSNTDIENSKTYPAIDLRFASPGGRDHYTLWRQAQLLKKSPFFVSTSDRSPLSEKQTIFLVLAGLKPVCEASSAHWVDTPGGRRTNYDDPMAVGAFLDSLGLAYHLQHDEYATDALVSLWPELLDAYEAATAAADQAKMGELLGYPLSAASAFADGSQNLLSVAKQDRLEDQAGIPIILRLSREHWQEELTVVQRWQTTLRQYGLFEP